MKAYGLIGYPLTHSFSKKYFADKFQKENLLNYSYELYPLAAINELPLLIDAHPDLKGLNVTIPYKEQVLKYATERSFQVDEIGAANTLKISGNKIIAYNTDVIGFEKSFIKKLKPHHKKALILGTGGASKAVQFVLKNFKIEFLIVSRKQATSQSINYSSIDEKIINEYTVIINCSPVGTFPNVSDSPEIPYQYISSNHYFFDLIYNPAKTEFLKKGEEKGAYTENGYEMLVLQAEESWKIWNEITDE